jgi:hypothetical protein
MKKLTVKNISTIVDKYPVKYEYGFTRNEIVSLLNEYEIDHELFYNKLGVNTCMIIDNQTITYHCDIEKALYCALENRDQHPYEWD